MVLGLRDLTRSVSAWAIAAEVVVGGGCGIGLVVGVAGIGLCMHIM